MKAIKVRIYPNKAQRKLLDKHFGCCRFAYNYALERRIKAYTETKKSISIYDIQKEITKLKQEKPWLKEVHSQAIQQATVDLESAFSHFFKKNNKFPRFKSRRNPKQSFRIPQGFKVVSGRKSIKLPKLKWIKFRDKFDFSDEIEVRNITISRDGNEYYASVCYDDYKEIPEPKLIEEDKTLGVDLGITHLAILSDKTKIDNPRHFKKHEDKLAEEQRKLSKKENKESKSYQKQKEKVHKVHKKIRNSRKDFLHKLTTSMVENQDYTSYAFEDLAVKEMEQDNSRSMSRAIGDVGWRMLRQIMEYKCKDRGKNFLVIGRFDPSSKTCSNCGYVYSELRRNQKEWICSQCGIKHDRDINAAKNIKNFALIKSLGKDFSEA